MREEKIKGSNQMITLLLSLTKNDFKSRYATSVFGIGWAYIQPLIGLLVMWYVFQVGLRSGDADGVPFIVWFAPASLAWTCFAEVVASVTMCMKEYSYLVCKVNFKIEIIPVIKVLSGCFVHVAFIFFLYFLCFVYHVPFTAYALQVWYYFFCMVVHLLAWGWLLSSILPFWPDVQSLVNIILQVGFWATPIVWNPSDMSVTAQAVSKLNPMYYICMGYRDSLIDHVWFWQRTDLSVYFWAFTLLLLLLGRTAFRKLRPQLADVL